MISDNTKVVCSISVSIIAMSFLIMLSLGAVDLGIWTHLVKELLFDFILAPFVFGISLIIRSCSPLSNGD